MYLSSGSRPRRHSVCISGSLTAALQAHTHGVTSLGSQARSRRPLCGLTPTASLRLYLRFAHGDRSSGLFHLTAAALQAYAHGVTSFVSQACSRRPLFRLIPTASDFVCISDLLTAAALQAYAHGVSRLTLPLRSISDYSSVSISRLMLSIPECSQDSRSSSVRFQIILPKSRSQHFKPHALDPRLSSRLLPKAADTVASSPTLKNC